jgi:riboflavin synthase
MFTGLIEEIGTVAGVERGRGLRLGIRARQVLEGLKVGDSIAVSGPCLTVEEVSGNRFWASLLPETAERTTLGGLRQGDRVNLERPLRMGDRLGGHLVVGMWMGWREWHRCRSEGRRGWWRWNARRGWSGIWLTRGRWRSTG